MLTRFLGRRVMYMIYSDEGEEGGVKGGEPERWPVRSINRSLREPMEALLYRRKWFRARLRVT